MYTFYFTTLNHVKCITCILKNVELYIWFLVIIADLLEIKNKTETETETWKSVITTGIIHGVDMIKGQRL